jgi:hypothetical protein
MIREKIWGLLKKSSFPDALVIGYEDFDELAAELNDPNVVYSPNLKFYGMRVIRTKKPHGLMICKRKSR